MLDFQKMQKYLAFQAAPFLLFHWIDSRPILKRITTTTTPYLSMLHSFLLFKTAMTQILPILPLMKIPFLNLLLLHPIMGLFRLLRILFLNLLLHLILGLSEEEPLIFRSGLLHMSDLEILLHEVHLHCIELCSGLHLLMSNLFPLLLLNSHFHVQIHQHLLPLMKI